MTTEVGAMYESQTTHTVYEVYGTNPVEPWQSLLRDARGYQIKVDTQRLLNTKWFLPVGARTDIADKEGKK